MVRISRVDAAAYTIPTEEPESDGTFAWKATTLVLATVTAGETRGIGFSYAAAGAARVLRDMLAPLLVGADPRDIPGLHARMMQEIRNTGREGLARMAVSAADIALWDLKARLLDLPLAKLLGQAREAVPVYGSGGFTSYTISRLQEQFAGWKKDGIRQMKMKVGRVPEEDGRRIGAAREAIGDDCALFIDANGAYGVKQALSLARVTEGAHVSWFEEPVSSDDVAGLRLLRRRLPASMEVAAGEYAWTPDDFRALLEGEAVDCLQADATRCGGITGFLEAAALSAAHHIPLSAHTAPSIHCAVCCAAPVVRHIEYFYDHARIEQMFFDGFHPPVDGALRPDQTQPGLGLTLRQAVAEPFRAAL